MPLHIIAIQKRIGNARLCPELKTFMEAILLSHVEFVIVKTWPPALGRLGVVRGGYPKHLLGSSPGVDLEGHGAWSARAAG